MFYFQIRLVVEEGLNQLPFDECTVTTPTGQQISMLGSFFQVLYIKNDWVFIRHTSCILSIAVKPT